jgi:hypothetical protein
MATVTLSDDNAEGIEERETKLPIGRTKPKPKLSKGQNRARASLKPQLPLSLALPAKQERFARLVSIGESQTDAYRKAFGAEGMTDKSVHEAACKLAHSSKVEPRIEQLKAVQLRCDWQDMNKMRALALETLAVEAAGQGPDTKSASRVAAAVAIGKIQEIALFADHKVIEHRDDVRVAMLKDKLEQRLKALFATHDAALQRQGDDHPRLLPSANPATPPEGDTPLSDAGSPVCGKT